MTGEAAAASARGFLDGRGRCVASYLDIDSLLGTWHIILDVGLYLHVNLEFWTLTQVTLHVFQPPLQELRKQKAQKSS